MFRTDRLDRLRKSLKTVDALLVTDIVNVRYLTGFTGSSGYALIARDRAVFITDFRYRDQAEKEVAASAPPQAEGRSFGRKVAPQPYDIMIVRDSMPRAVGRLVRKLGVMSLGFESSISYEAHEDLARRVGNLKATRGAVQRLRQTKDAAEVAAISEAVRRAEGAFIEVKPYIRAGVTERSVALRLEERLKKKGCRRIPFDIIVASGPNSAMPHAGVTDRKLAPGDLVTLDWGGEAGGYFSDMTRTVLLRGKDTARKREIYGLVLKANRAGRGALKAGETARRIDAAARDIIREAGYGECFGHGLGHGVGLEVHEHPRISWSTGAPMKEGMVVTIEPGVYVTGLGGVRIEDMLVVERDGSRLLTSLPRRLEVL